jgi:hypothetical protein
LRTSYQKRRGKMNLQLLEVPGTGRDDVANKGWVVREMSLRLRGSECGWKTCYSLIRKTCMISGR